jgi:hypothetical protein
MPRTGFHRRPETRATRAFFGLLLLGGLLMAGTAHAQNPLLGAGKVAKSPIRGSFINIGNALSINTIDRDAQLTYNPLYTVTTTANMRYWLNNQINLRLGVGFSREITNNDFTTQRDEIVLNDTTFGVGAFLWKIPVVDILTIGSLDLRFPTGPFSQAQTMRVSVQPRIIFFKQFSGLAGLNLAFVTGFNDQFFQYQTGSADGPARFCAGAALGCDPTDTGVRNARLRLVNALAVGTQPTSWVGTSASVAVLHDYLYPQADEPREAFQPIEDQDTRTFLAYNLEVFFIPAAAFQIAFGASTFGAQRAPNGQTRTPFFNLNTNLVAELRINVANAIASFKD